MIRVSDSGLLLDQNILLFVPNLRACWVQWREIEPHTTPVPVPCAVFFFQRQISFEEYHGFLNDVLGMFFKGSNICYNKLIVNSIRTIHSTYVVIVWKCPKIYIWQRKCLPIPLDLENPQDLYGYPFNTTGGSGIKGPSKSIFRK